MASIFSVSWTDIFPVLDAAMLEATRQGRSEEEIVEFEEHFGILCEHRPSDAQDRTRTGKNRQRHLVSTTLFWKHVNGKDPDLPSPTRERLVDARRLGLVKRFSPWESYLEPLYLHSAQVMARHPEVEFVAHLARDLDFLVPELLNLGWTVKVMKSSSIRYCPGGFWRFLPLEEPNTLVTVIDSDRLGEVSGEIERSELMDSLGLGLWRVPGYYHAPIDKEIRYRPILGGHFGARSGLMPVRELIEAFLWHAKRGSLPKSAKIPRYGEVPIKFADWPDYGFDEWFQLAAMYPRFAPAGVLSFIPIEARSVLLPLDLEYVTAANPRSEMIYF